MYNATGQRNVASGRKINWQFQQRELSSSAIRIAAPPAREGREGSSYNTNAVQLTRHFYTRTNAKNGTGDFNERGGQGGRIEIKSIEAGQCEVGCTKVRGNAIDQESRNVWLVDQGFSLILRGETAKR